MSIIRHPYDYTNNSIRYFNSNIPTIKLDFITYIQDNLERIIYLFDNDEYDQLVNLIPPLGNAFNLVTNYDKIVIKLFLYCINKSDITLLKKIIPKSIGINLFDIANRYPYDIVMATDSLVWELILIGSHPTDEIIESFFRFVLICNKINLLEKIPSTEYQMDPEHIYMALDYNNVDMIRYALLNNYNIQSILDKYPFNSYSKIDISMIKLLVEYDIDIGAQINNILLYAIDVGKMDLVIYCIENNYNCDINVALKASCKYAKLDYVVYFLQLGADIATIEIGNVRYDNIKLLKLLVDYGYNIPIEYINVMYSMCFIHTIDITDIDFLIELGADPEDIFKWEYTLIINPSYEYIYTLVNEPKFYHNLNSYLEFIVSMNYISHITYLTKLNFDKLLLELDRLFIIACANGCLDMVIYLLKLGTDINTENNMALIVACYFGHLNIVEFLLDKINLNDVVENLLMVIVEDYTDERTLNNKESKFLMYRKIIKNSTTFRNDIYNYGNDHVEIFKLLCDRNIILNDYEILKILPERFYSIEFISCMISNGFDINYKFKLNISKSLIQIPETATVLGICIILNKFDIVKYLVEYESVQNIHVS